MEIKQCTNCKEYKNISDFSYRNITAKKENKKRLLSICKECNNLKSKEYYYKNKHKHINYVYRFLNKNEEVLYIEKEVICQRSIIKKYQNIIFS